MYNQYFLPMYVFFPMLYVIVLPVFALVAGCINIIFQLSMPYFRSTDEGPLKNPLTTRAHEDDKGHFYLHMQRITDKIRFLALIYAF